MNNTFFTFCTHRQIRHIAFSMLMTLSISAWAGPGHDHGDETPSPSTDTQAPRFTVHNEHIEAVGVVREHMLHLYVDQHDTNEPINPKTLALTLNNTPVEMTPKTEGYFEGPMPRQIPGSEIQVQLNVSTEERTDTLSTTWSLDSDEEEHSHSEENNHSNKTLLFGLIGVLLAGVGTLIYKITKNTRRAS